MTEANGTVAFGAEMRKLFNFADNYTPLNHGAYGTFPRAILEKQQDFQRQYEARPSVFETHTYPELLKESRAAIAPLLGAEVGDVGFVRNASTGTSLMLGNLKYEEGDVILHLDTLYGACVKSIQFLEETTVVKRKPINVTLPATFEVIVQAFKDAIREVKDAGLNPKVAVFDTIVSQPGFRLPWEDLVKLCRDNGILSAVDAAHAVGHIDMTHTAEVSPDFLVSNCHKWLYVPRGCGVLYVPARNHHLLRTTFPTSWGFLDADARAKKEPSNYFVDLLQFVSTTDNSAYLCIPEAIKWRQEVCGGEQKIREYCHQLARQGGKRMAEILGTETMVKDPSPATDTCFAMVRLPVKLGDGEAEHGETIASWIHETAIKESDTYIPVRFYAGNFWVRISAQIYLTMENFEWAAHVLLKLSERASSSAWQTDVA